MHDDIDRLSDVLDQLASERNPLTDHELNSDERMLARTAALIRSANIDRTHPSEAFVESLALRISEAQAAIETAGIDKRPSRPRRGVTRRGALMRAAATVAGVAASGAGLAAIYERGKSDGSDQEAGARLTAQMVPVDRGVWLATGHFASQIQPGDAARFRAGALEGFLVRPAPESDIYALSAVCTHMGCMLSWVGSTDTFLCPCHGAQYNADGSVLTGIARHPLPQLRIRVAKDGGIHVWTVAEHPNVTTLEPYNRA